MAHLLRCYYSVIYEGQGSAGRWQRGPATYLRATIGLATAFTVAISKSSGLVQPQKPVPTPKIGGGVPTDALGGGGRVPMAGAVCCDIPLVLLGIEHMGIWVVYFLGDSDAVWRLCCGSRCPSLPTT